MPDYIDPPSLTNAILRLADGTLVLSIESNKPFLDTSKVHAVSISARPTVGRPGPTR